VTIAPRNLDGLRAVRGLEAKISAADAYIAAREAAIRAALAIRNTAILALACQHGPAEAARRAGRSNSHVK
jgi:hypothetical protein